MLNRKIIVLTMLVVALFAVSAVGAADNATLDVVGADESTDMSVADNPAILEKNDVGTFTDLADEIANATDELNLTRNYIYCDDDSGYREGIAVTKSIVINGNGFTIDGNGQANMLEISASNVSLKNVCFANAFSGSAHGGSAIRWYGDDGVMSDCSFVNTSSIIYDDNVCYSGAVYWAGKYGTLSDCSFVNSYSFSDENAGYGGAVYWQGDEGVMSYCSFANSSSASSESDGCGGAVYWKGNDGMLSDCSFMNCSADFGGALYWSGSNGNVVESKFTDCRAEYDGGGIYFSGDNCSLVYSIFKGNVANNGSDWYSLKHLDVISNMSTVIQVSSVNTTYGSSKDLIIMLKDANGDALAGQQITILLNKEYYYKTTDSNGQVSLPIPKMTPKNYTATVSYEGNGNYKPSCAVAYVVVSRADTVISASDVSVAYKDKTGELIATLTNVYGKALGVNVNVNFNGVDYTVRADSKGRITFPVGVVTPGTYGATISYNGNVNYNPSSTVAYVVVSRADTVISASDVCVSYKDTTGQLLATIKNIYGNSLGVNVNVNFNGVDYIVRADSKGRITFPVGVVSPGTYGATISYKGNVNYNPSSAVTYVVVTRADTQISASNVFVAYKNTTGELVATLTNEYGKPLSVKVNVNFNGEIYTIKTDSKGKISIPIGVLTPEIYVASISYDGNVNYNPSSALAYVVVSRADTVISASDVTVNCGDENGKLVATLKNAYGNGLGVNVNVNLDGQNYTMKANSKGQIIIPTAGLAAGSHVAGISYKGNANYNPTSTTANIIVKP